MPSLPEHSGVESKSGVELIKDYNETDYRTVWEKPQAVFSGRFEDRLARRLLTPDPGWFIDLGAGYGRLYPLYAAPGRKVVMVDYAANLIDLAARSLRDEPDVYFVVANAYHLPFRPEVFAAGLSVRTFHHMTAPERFLRECARVLRADAHMVMEYSNKRNLLRSLRHPRSALRRDHEEYGDMMFGTHPAYFAQLAGDAGFAVGDTLGTGFLSRLASERMRSATAPLAAAETALGALCGSHNLAPMSFVDLVKRRGAASPAGGETADATLAHILQCPACAGSVVQDEQGIHCQACGRLFPVSGAVLDLRYTGRPDGA